MRLRLSLALAAVSLVGSAFVIAVPSAGAAGPVNWSRYP
jgi:hypothetical protein